jgi:hypothetical protein
MHAHRLRTYCCILLLMGCAIRCKQTYAPPAITMPNNYLVVDGFINSGANAVTTITLTRTRNLNDTTVAGIPELYALVSILGPGGVSYPLVDTANAGIYSSATLNLDNTQQYSIAITTSDTRKYASDAVPCLQTPPIDSLYWQQPSDLTIYVNTADPTGQTRYYRWDYTETWQHDAQLPTPWIAINGVLEEQDSTNQTTECWTTDFSRNVLIASSQSLSQPVINAFPVVDIPNSDARLDLAYSILVRQYALTAGAYTYWQLIQKTSEQLGTLFDLQPTQLVGNLHCLTNPAEPVIGFMTACTLQQKRIFVYESSLTNWLHNTPGVGCSSTQIAYDPDSFPAYSYPDTTYGPYFFNGPTLLVIAPKFCLDCRYLGGTNIQPSFWIR